MTPKHWSNPRRRRVRGAYTATRSPPKAARRRSRSNPANARVPSFAGRATSVCATRSPAGDGTHGPQTATPRRASADTATSEHCGPSVAHGAESSDAAGSPTPPTTPTDTPACNSTPPSRSPTRRAPGPTSQRRRGCSAQPSPKPTLDTGRLRRQGRSGFTLSRLRIRDLGSLRGCRRLLEASDVELGWLSRQRRSGYPG
jgi:hypothetical protein